jgi:hypothetical protein
MGVNEGCPPRWKSGYCWSLRYNSNHPQRRAENWGTMMSGKYWGQHLSILHMASRGVRYLLETDATLI